MFHLSGEEIASIAVVAGFVVLYFRTVKDRRRERRERIELNEEVSELSARLLKALQEQEKCAFKVSEVTEQLDKARREQIEMREKFVSARCLDVQPGSRAANGGLRSTRLRSEVVEGQGQVLLQKG
jgi:hypothetical protein